MPENNTLKINALPAAVTTTAVEPRLAVGMPFAKMRYIAGIAGDENAPHFDPSQQPLQDGRAYTAKDGHLYYRPLLRISRRPGDLPGPDVRFLKDADGNVRLQFSLEESPLTGLPAGAEPFNVRVDSVTLHWRDAQGQDHQRVFDQPTLMGTDNPEDSTQSNFVIRVGSELDSGEVEPLFQALSRADSAASLQVVLSFGYWTDDPQSGGGHTGSGGVVGPVIHHGPVIAAHEAHLAATLLRTAGAQPSSGHPAAASHTLSPHLIATLAGAGGAAVPRNKFATLLMADRLKMVVDAERKRRTQPNFHTASLDRRLPFTFDSNLQANRPIYAALLGTSGITEHWTDSGFGLVRTADFPNTVYRLPDEIRLAFHVEMGTPYLIPFLYRTDQDEVRVRVTLGAMPWHNPTQLVGLRDFLRVSTGGALAAPSVVTGGYESATLRLTSAFPEQIQALDGEEVAISLENGFQVTLDLSLEFYRFLAELLTRENSPGLTGEVKVRLETLPPATDGGTEQVLERRVPVRLTFDDLAGLPLEVHLPPDALSPRKIEIANLAPLEVSLGGCLPRLLQYDTNSVTPLEVYEAEAVAPDFPATLAAQGTLTVDLEPKSASSSGSEDASQVWNAVQAELAGQNLTETPSQVLDRVHEIFPNTSLAQKVTVECPVFEQATLPDKFANLFRLKVKLLRGGFAAEQVVLGKDTASAQVTLQRNLKEILGEQAGALATFKYQVQNVYFDHEGQWSDEKDGEGTNVFVFPNPPESD